MPEIASKWPRLLVVGDPVPVALAEEILVRTDGWYLSTNDKPYLRKLCAALGAAMDGWGSISWTATKSIRRRVGALHLDYLRNERIVSAWIGGPHGWCDWDGRIGCSTHSIGKWPTWDAVNGEWISIAAAFPALSLMAQLVEDEGLGAVCAQWRIAGGRVEVQEPGDPIAEQAEPRFAVGLVHGAERGIDPVRLREIVDRVAAERRSSG